MMEYLAHFSPYTITITNGQQQSILFPCIAWRSKEPFNDLIEINGLTLMFAAIIILLTNHTYTNIISYSNKDLIHIQTGYIFIPNIPDIWTKTR